MQEKENGNQPKKTFRKLQPLCEKIGRERVEEVVSRFYAKLLADEAVKDYFAHIEDMDAHLLQVSDYWWLAMGGMCTPQRPTEMIARHENREITEAALKRWLEHFEETLNEVLEPPLAMQWLQMAQAMGNKLRQHHCIVDAE